MKFKLPDFRTHQGLNDIRRKMGAELIVWEDIEPSRGRRISLKDLKALETVGLEIDIDAVETQPNGTLTYQGEHVLLYIMQPRRFREKITWPKYHISNCSKWSEMKSKGRQDRYVASRRVDGVFELDVPTPGGTMRQEHSLNVCKLCLDNVHWKGYTLGSPGRNNIFRAFSLAEFFEVQKKTLIKERPRFTPATMPSAHYTDDFDEISSAARAAAKWKCMDCGLSLTKTFERRFLHAHHISGNKGDNSKENLRVLCLGCHANQPDHRHMKKTKEYAMYEQLFGSR